MKRYWNMNVVLFMAVAIVFFACTQTSEQKKQLGIATYSVKGMQSDIEGSLQALQDDGFVVMEVVGYNADDGTFMGYSPAEFVALTESYGLDVISSQSRAQFDVNDVEGTLTAWGKVFDDHQAVGCKYVIIPMKQWPDNVEDLKVECDLMNKIGEEANKRGLKFGYHNHFMEFDTFPGTDQLLEDLLIANTDPDKVCFMMDVFWITRGGQDPVEYLQKYPDRFKVLHIKDDYVIGESGKIDFEAIFNQFYENGHTDWFVEIENKMTEEELAQMMDRLRGMNQPQNQVAEQEEDQPGGERPPLFPQLTPEEEAENLKISLEAIRKSAEYLSNASFVK